MLYDMKRKKRPLAFFDLDGTIFRSSLLIELDSMLVKYGIFPPIVEKEVESARTKWINRHGSYEDYINRVVSVHHNRLAGCAQKDVERVAKMVIDQQKHHVYVYTRELIKKLSQTHTLVAISGSPIEVVKRFARAWKFDEYYATEHEVVNGMYTHTITKLPVEDKKQVVYDVAKAYGVSLARSIGVGDTESDIKFLEVVSRPICFNPNNTLYRVAQKRGWSIVVERKDVVYTIK